VPGSSVGCDLPAHFHGEWLSISFLIHQVCEVKVSRPDYPDTPRDSLIEHIPDDARKLLDVGCAKGAFGHALKSRLADLEVWGVEPDESAAAVARDRLDFVLNDFFSPSNPLPKNYFDVITFNDSLEHMPDPPMMLDCCKALLAPGGRVHCCIPNIRHVECLEHLIFEKDWHYQEMGVRDKTHLRFFTRKSIVDLFEDRGFRVIKVVNVAESWWEKKKVLRRLFFRLFPGFTEDMRFIQFLVIAELRNS